MNLGGKKNANHAAKKTGGFSRTYEEGAGPGGKKRIALKQGI